MKNSLTVNNLIKWDTGTETVIERILWIDSDYYMAFVIDIYKKQCVPQLRKVEDILLAIKNGTAEKLSEDPLIKIIPEENIDLKHREIQDNAWNIISAMVSFENEPDVYYRKTRRKLILNAAQRFNVSDRVIYKYLTKYWQRGMVKNALLPDYDKSGGKGKSKVPGDKKLGRPRKNIDSVGIGINVGDSTKKIFRIAYNQYYETSKGNFLTDAYTMMLKDYYSEDYRIVEGVRKPIIIPINDIPSFDQFKYWYYKEQNIKEATKKRKGKKRYELENRAVLGRSDENLMGPGSLYQIDATVADVYLVSRFNRNWIIGRPVVYVVVDAFSREVVGLYIGLEGPSWIGAMMALANTFSDKVRYCSEYGINIDFESWPCCHIPQAILGDRGEMEGKMPETMIKNLGIRISNTPPYRADWKGIVEQYFRLLDIKVKPFVPGHIDKDFRQRGAKDYRCDAKLDIYQFTQIIIKCVLYYNNERWMESYNANEMMIMDDIDPIPREIWNWGIEKRSGRLKSLPEDIVKLNLMPSNTAMVKKNGIRFKNMLYSSDKAIKEMWFEIARNKAGWKVDISYDPRNMDYVYIRSDDGKSFIKCNLLGESKYKGKTLDEIENLDTYNDLKKDNNKEKSIQSKVDLFSDIESIVSAAEKMTDDQKDPGISKASMVKGIRDNRKREKLNNRKVEAIELEKNINNTETMAEVISFKKDDTETYSYPGNIEYLRRKQRERMGKKDEDRS